MGAIALTVASYLTLVAVAFFESGAGPHQSYARFESARPAEVIVPQSDPAAATEQLSELVRRAATEGRKVSIAGSQHSMGGHTLVDAGWLVDMRCDAFRQIDSVEVRGSRATVHVGSGATWHEVLLAFDQQGWSVDVMQSNDDFTVGGSISVNCHGWNPATESSASTVESFTLIKADGKHCAMPPRSAARPRAIRRGLRRLRLAWYHYLGRTARGAKRTLSRGGIFRLRRKLHFASIVAAADVTIGLAYGRISVAPGPWFLNDARITHFVRVDANEAAANTLLENGGIFGVTATEIDLTRAGVPSVGPQPVR